MKLGELKSLGHNIADSLASGVGVLIGVYVTDIFFGGVIFRRRFHQRGLLEWNFEWREDIAEP